MLPVLIKIGPITINTYGFILAVGVAAGFWFLIVQAKKHSLNPSKVTDMAFYTLIFSLIGSKIVLFVGDFSYYIKYPKEIFSLARSGGVFQGGLTFGIIFGLWYVRKYRIPTWKLADIIGPALALGHGFGRIGCFSAGCCFGRDCSFAWGVTFNNEYSHNLTGIPINTPLHPVQLYEAALNFLNFFLLFVVLKRKKFHGQIFSLYIINYSIIRYFVEFFRGDHPDKFFSFKISLLPLSISYPQIFCILGIIGGIILYKVQKKRGPL